MIAIDTNVLVYAIDRNEPTKQTQAQELLAVLLDAGETVLIWQVLGEYLSCLRRFATTKRFPAKDIETEIHDLLQMFPLAFPSGNQIAISLSLFNRFQLSHWDSMLLSACIVAGVDTLFSEDLSAGTKYDTVTVINPFTV